jgi:hypothetical protein
LVDGVGTVGVCGRPAVLSIVFDPGGAFDPE